MFTKRSAISKSVIAIMVLVLLLVASYLYFSNELNRVSSTTSVTIQGLQKAVGELQSRNSDLEGQLASTGGHGTNPVAIGLDPVQIYNATNRSVVTIQGVNVTTVNDLFFGPRTAVAVVLGSGFVVNYSGSLYVVTNYHVVNGMVNASVTFWNGDAYRAQVVGTDRYSDLAVVSVSAPKSEFYPLTVIQSSAVKVGEPVIAIGNPFGLSGSMTFGIISQLGRTISESTAGNFAIANIIQFSAPINPGNSGGPLMNADGAVIGITTAVVGGSQGLGFAIPSSTILRELPFLISTGRYDKHPYMGIAGVDMNYELAQAAKSNVTYGVLLQTVVSGGPADKAGMRAGSKMVHIGGQQYAVGGDIIVSIDGTRIVNQDSLSSYLEQHTTAGQTIQIGIVRDGSFMTISLVLGVRPPPA